MADGQDYQYQDTETFKSSKLHLRDFQLSYQMTNVGPKLQIDVQIWLSIVKFWQIFKLSIVKQTNLPG